MRSVMWRERYQRSALPPRPPAGQVCAMRKLMMLVGALAAVHVALLFVRPAAVGHAAAADAVRVGIVLDVGGLGDKSFNDGAYRGAQLAEQKLGAQIRLIEPGEATDREAGLRVLAAEHM